MVDKSLTPQFSSAPHDWKLIPLKRLMRVTSGTEVSVEIPQSNDAVPVYGSGVKPFKYTNRSISAKAVVLFGRKGTLGQPFLVDPPFWAVDTAYIATPRENVELAYLYYLLKTFDWQPFITNTAKPSLVANDILPEKVPLPQHQGQVAILRYLDAKTAEIDGLIEKLRREVELLEQYRRELIARTVTRGLDPDVPMRDSGIEWMPQIPSHWAVLQGKRVFTKLQRPVREGSETITCFRDGTVTLRRNRRSEGFTESLQEIGYQGVEPGDLVIHEMDAFAGAIGVSDSYGKSTPVYAVCAIQNNGDPHFYAYLLRQMAQSDFILSLAKGIRQRTVDFRFKTLASLLVAMPPSSEQKQIANFLDGRMLEIDSTIFGINKQIELLNRYRKQVINDAVTGKICVEKVA